MRFILCIILCIALAPVLLGFWVHHQVQKRMDIKLSGIYIPLPFVPVYYLKNAAFEFEDKVRLKSGNLKMVYHPFSLLTGELRFELSSKKINAELLGEWAAIEGMNQVVLSRFKTDLTLGRKGIREIHEVDAFGPQFQFQIKHSE